VYLIESHLKVVENLNVFLIRNIGAVQTFKIKSIKEFNCLFQFYLALIWKVIDSYFLLKNSILKKFLIVFDVYLFPLLLIKFFVIFHN